MRKIPWESYPSYRKNTSQTTQSITGKTKQNSHDDSLSKAHRNMIMTSSQFWKKYNRYKEHYLTKQYDATWWSKFSAATDFFSIITTISYTFFINNKQKPSCCACTKLRRLVTLTTFFTSCFCCSHLNKSIAFHLCQLTEFNSKWSGPASQANTITT